MRREPGSFGEELRDRRHRAGLTQQELAERAGVSVRAVRDIELGRVRRPRPASMRRLATAVGVAPAEPGAGAATTTSAPSSPPPGAHPRPPGVTAAGSQRLTPGGARPADAAPGSPTGGHPTRQALLGLLALRPNQVVGYEEIIDTLWGEHPPPSCRKLVHTYAAQLRRRLEPPRSQGGPAQTQVRVAPGGGHLLTLGESELDLLRFDALMRRPPRRCPSV